MGVKGGPDIETDGLVFHLDAAATNIGKGYSTEGLRVEYLVVAGGGGGSGWGDGVGGGAGGFLSSVTRLTPNTYAVVVGAGGNRGTNSSSSRGSNGGNSQIGDSIIAYGGGGAGCKVTNDGLSGGSGGGGYGDNVAPNGVGGSGVAGQGYDGGDGINYYRGGGGGGAGAPGTPGTSAPSNGLSKVPGGIGKVAKIDFVWQYYAGGGGVGGCCGRGDGSGGLGGGGSGGDTNTDGIAGETNTGGGGGGGGSYFNRATYGGNGGSGIVMIRYWGKQKATGGDIIQYKNGYTIHTFTSSGSFILSESVDGTSSNKIVGGLKNMDSSNFNNTNKGYFTFDGTNEYIDLPTINVNASANTICTWARKANTDGGFHNIYTPWSNGFDNWLGSYTNKWLLFVTQAADVGNVFLYSNSTIVANTWYFICSTVDSNVAKLYVNGELNFTVSLGFTIGSWNAAATIGRRATISNYYWEGDIASISVYNYGLSAKEILDNYNATKGRFGL